MTGINSRTIINSENKKQGETNMKKIALLTAISAIIPFASANAMNKTNFVSLNILPTSSFEIRGGGGKTLNTFDIGGSVEYGRVINEWFKASIELGARSGEFYPTMFFDNYNATINGYFYTTLADQFQPFVAVGIGASANDMYNTMAFVDTETDFTYSVKAGMNVIVNNYLDLHMGVKYQNYGELEGSAIDFTDVFFGASYKF